VIRYLTYGGRLPDEDICAFASWFAIHGIAKTIYEDWCPHTHERLFRPYREGSFEKRARLTFNLT
jgi:hypothetical protein